MDITSENHNELENKISKDSDQEIQIHVLDNETISVPLQSLPTTSSMVDAVPQQGVKRKYVEKPIESPR